MSPKRAYSPTEPKPVMIEVLKRWDAELFFLINDQHTNGLDPLMYWLSQTEVWIPLFLFLIYLIVVNFRKQSWLIIALILLTVAASDQVTSGLMKPIFHRFRPSHDPALEPVVHIVYDYRGGLYGFASSHAANTMAVATFFYLLFRDRYRKIKWLFLWTFINCYTRVYLGVHFPGDILVGAVIGWLLGWGGFAVLQMLRFRQKAASDT